MLIKYKGHTSEILTDICVELNIPVNLTVSEEILKHFFSIAFRDLDTDKSIELLINLPPFLKPFLSISNTRFQLDHPNDNLMKVNFEKGKQPNEICAYIFSPSKSPSNVKGILNVLKKYVVPSNLEVVYSYMPENFFFETRIVSRIAV